MADNTRRNTRRNGSAPVAPSAPVDDSANVQASAPSADPSASHPVDNGPTVNVDAAWNRLETGNAIESYVRERIVPATRSIIDDYLHIGKLTCDHIASARSLGKSTVREATKDAQRRADNGGILSVGMETNVQYMRDAYAVRHLMDKVGIGTMDRSWRWFRVMGQFVNVNDDGKPEFVKKFRPRFGVSINAILYAGQKLGPADFAKAVARDQISADAIKEIMSKAFEKAAGGKSRADRLSAFRKAVANAYEKNLAPESDDEDSSPRPATVLSDLFDAEIVSHSAVSPKDFRKIIGAKSPESIAKALNRHDADFLRSLANLIVGRLNEVAPVAPSVAPETPVAPVADANAA